MGTGDLARPGKGLARLDLEEELALPGLSQPLPFKFSHWPGCLALFLLYYQCIAMKQDVYRRVLVDALYLSD